MCLGECCIPRRRAGPRLIHAAFFCLVLCCCCCWVFFVIMQTLPKPIWFANAIEKNSPLSRSLLTVKLAVVMNHSPSHWLSGMFAVPQTVCTPTDTHHHINNTVMFWCFFRPLCIMVLGVVVRGGGDGEGIACWDNLHETIRKLPSFTKAAVIADDLYRAYGTNCFLCGQMVACTACTGVAMTTGRSAICIHI